MRRIFMFLLTNLLVVLTIGIVLSIVGVYVDLSFLSESGIEFGAILIFSFIVGFSGSLISLAMSRIIAKKAMRVHVLQPGSGLGWQEQRIVDKVHALCRQAGLRVMPEVGLYESAEVNAFATGPSKSRSLVALSTGLVERLDERAVDAVIAHEVAHIVNGDMVTMSLLQGVINTFVIFFSRVVALILSRAVRPQLQQVVYILCVVVFDIVLSILGSLVVMAYSRHREFKADSGAATLVGRADMAHALRSLMRTTELVDGTHKSLSTLKINGRPGWMQLFSSHPPIEERIRRLEI